MADQQVKAIVAECFEMEPEELDSGTPIRGLAAFDSLSFLKLIVALDEEAGVEIDHSDLESVSTVGDLTQLVVRKQAA